jgi:hypothetical protein
MIEACDPDANIDDLRAFIKMNTGQDVTLTKKQVCQVYDEIKAGKLPLPPLIMSSNKTYLIDKKSPLKPNDYEILFDSSSKRSDIKRVARKVGLKQLEQMTKSQMIDSIGKRLRYMKIHEPVKIGKKRAPSVKKMNAFNNTAVNANANRFNNTAVKTENTNRFNNTAVNANANRFNNTAVKTENTNRFNNTAVKTENTNRFNNTAVKTENTNRFNNTVVKTENTNRFNNTVVRTNGNTTGKKATSRVNFPKGSLFMTGQKPKFLNGRVSAVKKPKTSIFTGLFGPKRSFIKSNTFKGSKKGYVFKTGNQGSGYYLNEGPAVVQGPALPPNDTKTRDEIISDQKKKFMSMIVNVKLSDEDKKSLEDLIDNKTNLNSLKNRAEKLVEQRIKEKNAGVKQNLLTYLTPLKINQTNKNGFLARFNKGESIDVLKRAAKQREEEVSRGQSENTRSRLVRNLNALDLNAQNKNSIMSRFNNGNKNVTKLIEEAKKMKQTRNKGKLNTEKQRLNALSKQLGVNKNFSNNISKLNTINEITGLEERIRAAGIERVKGTFAEKVQGLSTIASKLDLNATIQSDILKMKNNSDLDAMKVRVLNAGKTKLSNRAKSLNVNFSKNIQQINKVNKLNLVKQKINTAGTAKQGAQKRREDAELAERRNKLKTYINNNTTLPENKKAAFTRQVNLNNTNLIDLRKEINSEIQKVKDNKRTREMDELQKYLQPLNIEKSKFIERFRASNISLENMKSAVNKEVAIKGNLDSKKRALADKIDTAKQYNVAFNFNTNTNKLDSPEKVEKLNRDVDEVIKSAIDKGRNKLSNTIIDAKLKNDFMNKVTAVKSLKNLTNVQKQIESAITTKKNAKKEEVTKYMKQLGLNNQEIQTVTSRNLSLNNSRKMVNDILDKKKRLELTQLLNKKKVPVTDRKQFYNKITKNSKIGNIERNVDTFLKNKSRENVSNVEEVLNKYNLKPEDREAILNDWDYFTNMTIINVKNKASNLSGQYKKEKEIALRRHLQDDLQLSTNDVNTIMRNFNTNPRNMNALHEKAKKLKNASGEKKRLTERIRKAREENKLNLKFNINKENLKTLNAKIDQAYVGKGKKNLARRALNRNLNISNELNAVKSLNNIQKLKNKLNGLINGKKREDLKKVEEAIRNLNQENKNRFLQKFKNQNNSLGNILENVKNFKKNLESQKIGKQRRELYTYIDETLNLNVKDRNSILFEFDNSKNLNAAKRSANALKKTRVGEKISENRKKLEEILKPMNLTQENKATILKKYDNAPGNLETFEANAKSLIQQKKNEKRSDERESLVKYMNNLGLSGENKNVIVGFFNQSPNKTLESAKNNATSTKKTRDQEKLENVLKNLPNISEMNKNKLRTNLKSGTTINNVLSSAKRLNASTKTKKSIEQSVVNYVSSKNIGTNGNKLIKNFKNGLLTANKVKEEANKKRESLNAETVTEKKKKLRNFMKNTLLSNRDKNRYIEQVKLNTELSNLERAIKSTDDKLRNERNTFARKQIELRTFLNGLTNLTSNQKTKFMGRVKNAGTDIGGIKREAERIDKAKKAGKKVTEERAKPKEENNFNATKALNILNKQREGEVKRLERAKPKEENNFNATKALNILNKQREGEVKRLERAKTKEENNFNTAKALKNLNNGNRMAKRKKVLNEIAKHTNERITKFKGRAGNPFRTAAEYNKIGENVKKMVELVASENEAKALETVERLNKNAKIQGNKNREALKKLLKSTKTNQKQSNEYMNAFEKGRKTFKELKENITMKAKRNALVRKLDKKPVKNENENEAMEASRLFNVGGDVKNLTRGKNEREVDKNVLEKTRKLVGFGIAGRGREKFLARGRGMQNTQPLVKELDERLTLINKVKNLPNRKDLEKMIRNSNTTINKVRVAVKMSQNKQNKNIANASKSLVAGAIGKIQAKENKNIANASKALVAGAIGNLKRKNVAATKIQAGFRGKKGRNQARRALLNRAPVAETFIPEPKMTNNPLFMEEPRPKPPNVPKPNKPSFRALVQKNKEKRVMNAVKLAGKKVALSRASGPERIKMARNLAPAKQENVKKVANAVAIFNRQSAISAVNRLKKLSLAEKTRFKGQISGANTKARIKEIQESAIREDARKKAEENRAKEEERKKKLEAESERVRKLKELKARRAATASEENKRRATREAAERAAASAKKMLTETEKMRAKAAENKKFNNRLAEKRRLLREREAKSEPKKRKPKKK